VALALSVGGAGAADCSEGFFKSDVKGSPPAEGSSFTCTTKVIECLPPTGLVVVNMYGRKALTPAGNQAQFTYSCDYLPPVK
jgi:hypothetical protein